MVLYDKKSEEAMIRPKRSIVSMRACDSENDRFEGRVKDVIIAAYRVSSNISKLAPIWAVYLCTKQVESTVNTIFYLEIRQYSIFSYL